MSDVTFGFVKQKCVGNKGEETFLSFYEGATKSTTDLKFDILYEGNKVEVKTDTYPMAKTKNFFMERFGDVKKKKAGGPWRSAQDGVPYFVYYFIEDGVFFWYDSVKLCEFLDTYIKKLKPKRIKNKSHTTVGYQVPREAIKHLLIRHDIVL